MPKSKKAYILYSYNSFNNDFNFISEYYNLKDLVKNKNIKLKNKNSLYHFIYKNLNDIKHLLNDKYIIITEDIKEL